MRSLPTLFFKKGSGLPTQFDRVTMPPILQSHLPPLPYSLGESVSRRLADRQPSKSRRCLIGIASLHQRYEICLCTASLSLVIHLFSSLVPFIVLLCDSCAELG